MNRIIAHFSHWLQRLQHTDPRILYGLPAAILLLAIALWLYIRSRRPSAQEIERRRREHIARIGRITDGFLVDARTLDGRSYDDPYSSSSTPDILVYSYRHAGVTYNCAQDVSTLPEKVRGYRLDQPVQIRYDTRNPGNSILVAESWSGLRLTR